MSEKYHIKIDGIIFADGIEDAMAKLGAHFTDASKCMDDDYVEPNSELFLPESSIEIKPVETSGEQ